MDHCFSAVLITLPYLSRVNKEKQRMGGNLIEARVIRINTPNLMTRFGTAQSFKYHLNCGEVLKKIPLNSKLHGIVGRISVK